jgi:hypothetical protein
MPKPLKHSRHLWRMVLLFAAWIGAFLAARAFLIPPGFGAFGHYRPGAVDDVAAQPVVFAGKAACLTCHENVSQDPAQNKHAPLSCEACHDALASHVEEPAVAPARPARENSLCLGCHLAAVAKPAWFKQVEPAAHYDGTCMDCHQPHAP